MYLTNKEIAEELSPKYGNLSLKSIENALEKVCGKLNITESGRSKRYAAIGKYYEHIAKSSSDVKLGKHDIAKEYLGQINQSMKVIERLLSTSDTQLGWLSSRLRGIFGLVGQRFVYGEPEERIGILYELLELPFRERLNLSYGDIAFEDLQTILVTEIAPEFLDREVLMLGQILDPKMPALSIWGHLGSREDGNAHPVGIVIEQMNISAKDRLGSLERLERAEQAEDFEEIQKSITDGGEIIACVGQKGMIGSGYYKSYLPCIPAHKSVFFDILIRIALSKLVRTLVSFPDPKVAVKGTYDLKDDEYPTTLRYVLPASGDLQSLSADEVEVLISRSDALVIVR
jgi:hypothetical protein